MGRGTAKRLAEAGCTVDIVPQGRFDSEALLATRDLQQVAGQRILIVRGDGGRPLLGNTLESRGANVEYAEVYRRLCPNTDTTPLLARWREDVQIVTATSNEILNNLWAMLGKEGRALLLTTPLVVISERMRSHAAALGFRQVILADGADDRSMLASLCDWAGRTG